MNELGVKLGYGDAQPDDPFPSMELLILNAFAKEQLAWIRVIDEREYLYPSRVDICECSFIAREDRDPYGSVLFSCTKPLQAKDFLDAYLDNYKNGRLKPFPGQNVYTWPDSVQKTLTVLIEFQKNYGNHFSVSYNDFDCQVNFGADLICLERMGVLKIDTTEEYESCTDFYCTLEIVGNLSNTLKQLCGNPVPRQRVIISFGDLRVYTSPFEVRFQQNKAALREKTLLVRLLVLLMKAPQNQCPRTDLCHKLYPKLVKKQQSVAVNRLKTLCHDLNKKLMSAGCPYRLHQKEQGTIYWCLKLR